MLVFSANLRFRLLYSATGVAHYRGEGGLLFRTNTLRKGKRRKNSVRQLAGSFRNTKIKRKKTNCGKIRGGVSILQSGWVSGVVFQGDVWVRRGYLLAVPGGISKLYMETKNTENSICYGMETCHPSSHLVTMGRWTY